MRTGLLAVVVLTIAAWASAQSPAQPPLVLVHPEGATGPPAVVTLQDALQRARQNDAQFQAVVTDAQVAHEDRVQARAALLPALSNTTQYLGNSPNGVNPNGRFVSLDGVKMYREWGVARQELSANTFLRTPLLRARALEAVAQANLEIALRGLGVTMTRSYYALVVAQRKYASAQQAAQQAARFLEITREQERLGQVARSDTVKADIQYQQLQQAFRESLVAMDAARLTLAVLISPQFDENFTVVDDLSAMPPLLPFAEARSMAYRANPDLRAAEETLRGASANVQLARNAFFPSLIIDGVVGIEANEFALHSAIAAQPELGILPNLGYFLTLNLNVPIWDWGALRSKLRQGQARERHASVALSQTQRQLLSNLYSMYNEALAARTAVEALQHVAELAAESLRLTTLRYQAGESTALEVVDAQNTLVQARNAADDSAMRLRVALAELQTLTGPF